MNIDILLYTELWIKESRLARVLIQISSNICNQNSKKYKLPPYELKPLFRQKLTLNYIQIKHEQLILTQKRLENSDKYYLF